MATLASLRLSTKCPRCELSLISPEWSENVSDERTMHIWHCPMCGNEFETVDSATAKTISDDETVGDFFSSLLVA